MDGTAAGGVVIVSLLDRYIGRRLIFGTLLVMGVLLALFMFVVVVDVLPDYGRGTFGLYELVRYVALSQPRKIYELFPVAVLVGVLLGLSTLAVSSELIAMRAAGVSRLRIVGAALKTGVVFVLAAIAIGEFVVPRAETLAQTGRAQALATGFQKGGAGVWLRDGAAFVNLVEVLPDLSLLGVSIFEFAPDAQLRTHTTARRAVYVGDGWRLENARQSKIDAEAVTVQDVTEFRWQATLTPDVVAVFAVRPEALSMQQLVHYIQHLRANGQETARYSLTLWQKLLMPFATAIMVLLATPFVFKPVRSGGLAQRIFVGILLGLAFVVVHRSLGYLAVIYGVAPFVAAAVPLLLFFALAVALLRRTQ
mgnify:CR=1 FL=1